MRASIIRSLFAACLLAVAVWVLSTGPAAGQEYPLPPPPPPPPPPANQPFTKLEPFPKVRLIGVATSRGARVKHFQVTGEVGLILVSRCTGKRKGCPYRERQQQIKGTPGVVRTVRINGLERRFYKTGARLVLFMTVDKRIGKYTSFRIRSRKRPVRVDRCTRGITLRARRCPK